MLYESIYLIPVAGSVPKLIKGSSLDQCIGRRPQPGLVFLDRLSVVGICSLPNTFTMLDLYIFNISLRCLVITVSCYILNFITAPPKNTRQEVMPGDKVWKDPALSRLLYNAAQVQVCVIHITWIQLLMIKKYKTMIFIFGPVELLICYGVLLSRTTSNIQFLNAFTEATCRHKSHNAYELLTPLPFLILGFSLICFGAMIRYNAYTMLGNLFTFVVMIRHGHRVVKDGSYHYIRHPSYSGLIIATIGFGMLLGRPGGMIGCFDGGFAMRMMSCVWYACTWGVQPVVVVFLLLRLPHEEAFLAKELGEEYKQYMAVTERLIPRVY
jgi:protein-S-isoprenylcysteine O-methyltransferase Ste14